MFNPWQGRRIVAVVGHYGSGKTELSLALALRARAQGKKACVVDLDIVNPFFRSAEQNEMLAQNEVRLIAPPYALTAVDVPVLPAEVLSVFEQDDLYTVLDVGGEDAGAAALGRYKPQFMTHPAECWYVVNAYRPFSERVEQVLDLMRRIELRGRIPVTGLINNANLGAQTEPEQVLEGLALVDRVAQKTGVPLLFSCVEESLVRAFDSTEMPLFPIRRRLMPQWLLD